MAVKNKRPGPKTLPLKYKRINLSIRLPGWMKKKLKKEHTDITSYIEGLILKDKGRAWKE